MAERNGGREVPKKEVWWFLRQRRIIAPGRKWDEEGEREDMRATDENGGCW